MITELLFRGNKQATLLDRDWWDDIIPKSTSGQTVTTNTAMGLAAYLRAITFIADTFASLPLDVKRRLPNGDKEDASDDYRYTMLHNKPNPEITSFVWRQTGIGHFYNCGNSYTQIVKNNAGDPAQLWILPADKTFPKRENDGRLTYHVKNEHGGESVLDYEDVIHVPAFSLDGITGMGIIQFARDVIGQALAQQEHGALFFANGAVPSGVVTSQAGPDAKNAREKSAESWKKNFGGKKKHSVAFLHPGQQYQSISIPNDSAQFIESQQFSVKQIANLFGLPSAYLNDAEGATHSNVEQKAIDLVRFLFNSLTRRWEQELNSKLFASTDLFCEFNLNGLLRGDIAARSTYYHNMVLDGILTKNEIRRLENFNAVEGGDEVYTPQNMVNRGGEEATITPIAVEAEAEVTPEQVEQAELVDYQAIYKPLLFDAAQRITQKEVKQISNIVKKHEGEELESNLLDYYGNSKGLHSYILQVITPLAESCTTLDVEQYASTWISSSKGQLLAVIKKEGDLLEVLDEWETSRPEKQANIEILKFTEGGEK